MKVAVLGGYGFGLTVFAERLPTLGETVSGASFLATPGGKGSNQAVAAARLGASVSLLTAIGTDAYSSEGRRLWQDEGVDASAVVTIDGPSMVGVIIVEGTGENRIIIAPGALERLAPGDVEVFEPLIARSDVLLVSTEIPAPVALAGLETARLHRVRTILNPAPAVGLPPDIWAHVDVVTPNTSEARLLVGVDPSASLSGEQLAQRVHEATGVAVVLTQGESGACIVDRAFPTQRIPAFRVDHPVDTTGAGDAFNGALAVALARGNELPEAVTVAMRAGAFAVQSRGVVPALPTDDDISCFPEQPD